MTSPEQPTHSAPVVGGADAALDQLLSDRLDEHNAAATPGIEPARELTVRVHGEGGEVVGGISGWTWGEAAGMEMVWVHADLRGSGAGAAMVREFETAARRRGCTHVFVTSFTFQAPGFYESQGYRELARWDGVPTAGRAEVHFRKDLG